MPHLRDASSRARALVRAYPLVVGAAAAGVAARIVFWVMTDRRFEDGLITVTHARNAAEGLGLTHHPGEDPTHGFTSAISVLVPLVGEVVHGGAGLFALRFVSLVAFVVAIVCAAGIGRHLRVSPWLMIFPLGYLAFDQNQIFYGMAGMETQIAAAVLLASAYALMSERLVVTGVLLGVALLARPDFILWVGPALVYLCLRSRREGLIAGSLAAIVLLPWIAFTTAYYGSPIPHTIRAKSARFPIELPPLNEPLEWFAYTQDKVSDGASLLRAWTPLLENSFVGRTPVDVLLLAYVAIGFMALAVVGAVWARGRNAWPVVVAYLGLFVLYRIYFLPPVYYEWYYGPFMALAAVAAGAGLAAMHALLPRVAIAASCALVLAFSVHLPITLVLEQRIQERVEDRVRRPMAKYLDDVVKPGERVVSESAGYVGYYSHVTLFDFPGLTSPGALRALETLDARYEPDQVRANLADFTNTVRPEWLVMRPDEWRTLEQMFPRTAALYELDRLFTVSFSESDLRYAGVEYGIIDREFLVLRRARAA